jgi:hypothetical protein
MLSRNKNIRNAEAKDAQRELKSRINSADNETRKQNTLDKKDSFTIW